MRLPSKLQGCFCCLLLFSAPLALGYEEPAYRVVSTFDGVEYRRYEPYLVVETVVVGELDRNSASNLGFRRLFAYISGANVDQLKIDMTAPVEQQPAGRKIDMTTPVQQSPGSDGWTVSFIVPRVFTPQTVPSPTDPAVYIREVPSELRAVLRYSGRWSERNVSEHEAKLKEKLARVRLEPVGEVTTAFYNAPFSLPFMRRNEVMVVVDELPAARQSISAQSFR